jgi:hypothetical protein
MYGLVERVLDSIEQPVSYTRTTRQKLIEAISGVDEFNYDHVEAAVKGALEL